MMNGSLNGTVTPGSVPAGLDELLRESTRLHGHLCAGQHDQPFRVTGMGF